MAPHPQLLHDALLLENLVDKPVLNIEASQLSGDADGHNKLAEQRNLSSG